VAITVRPGKTKDAAGICGIYNQGIEDRIATFETRLRAPDEIAAWFDDFRHPVMVAEEDGQILGFASTSAYSARECYAGIYEFSIYVHRQARRRGIARLLLIALFDASAKAGAWKLTSRIFTENTVSLELCRLVGFRIVGTHLRHAKLDGVWRDVVTVERLLDRN
jgi:phosphinothricin acetyltransferase